MMKSYKTFRWDDNNGYEDDDDIKEFEIVKKFKSHNVVKERVELFKDFTINLIHYTYKTYLGKEFIRTNEDIKGHFNWAFNKVVKEFEEEEIYFYTNGDLHKYFYGYFYNQFYMLDEMKPISYYLKFWDDVFSVKEINKKRKIFDALLEIYEIFDDSIVVLDSIIEEIK